MTNEELNTALYEKMFAEQKRYREWLLSQPPEKSSTTYEFTVRGYCSRNGVSRPDRQAVQGTFEVKSPLADVFRTSRSERRDHMDNIRDTIECRANAIIRQDFIRNSMKRVMERGL